MRIFGLVFGGVALAMLLLFGYQVGREQLVLWIAVNYFEKDLWQLKEYQAKGISARCGMENSDRAIGVQLRFEDESHYVVETICEGGNNLAQTEGQLWGGVKRQYGAGAALWAVEDGFKPISAMIILVNGKSKAVVGFDNGVVVKKFDQKIVQGLDVSMYDTPAEGNCNNWGFSCCDDKKSLGIGSRVFARDCINSCFTSCNLKPSVIFFNTDMQMQESDRSVVLLKSQNTLQLGYEIIDDGLVANITVDYGDGKKDYGLPMKMSGLTHTYTCHQRRCNFVAKISALDDVGNRLVDSPLNEIRIMMEP